MLEQSRKKKIANTAAFAVLIPLTTCTLERVLQHAQNWQYHRKVNKKKNHSRYQRLAAVSKQNWCSFWLVVPANGYISSLTVTSTPRDSLVITTQTCPGYILVLCAVLHFHLYYCVETRKPEVKLYTDKVSHTLQRSRVVYTAKKKKKKKPLN